MLDKNLLRYVRYFDGYTELRLQENRTARIALLNGKVVANEKNVSGGLSARVYRNGAWGFAAFPVMTGDAVSAAIYKAQANAELLASKKMAAVGLLPGGTCSSDNDFSTVKQRKSPSEVLEFLGKIDSYLAKSYKYLKSRNIVFAVLEMEKSFINSEGSMFYSMLPRTTIYISMSVDVNGKCADFYETWGGRGQIEDLGDDTTAFFAMLDAQYEHAVRKAEGIFPEAGLHDCVLAPELAGVLAHEAIGHTVEADLVLSGSVAGDMLNREVASPLVTLVDFAHTAYGQTCQTPVYVDDEGIPARDVRVIESGVLRSYLHNRESARHFSVEPTGNARAFTFSDVPEIRMRNTAILPGTSKVNAMIASIKNGYYLMRRNNGMADLTSEFMFAVTLGYEIRNGKLGRAIKDSTVSGIAYDVLRTVSMVSDDMHWRTFGFCGKRQPMLLSMGGPAIKCRIAIGGR